jgi:hypothetical protein
MPTNINDTAAEYVSPLQGPAAGEPRQAASVNDALQNLANRTAYLKPTVDGMAGYLAWSGTLQSASTTTVTVGRIERLILDGQALQAAETAIGTPKLEGGGSFAVDTWYYVYAWNNAGTLDYEISDTEPDEALFWKDGDDTRRYLGCFRTDGSGDIRKFTMTGREFTFRVDGIVAADRVLQPPGNDATSPTAVDLSAWVPPHARRVALKFMIGNVASAVDGTGYVQSENAGAAALELLPISGTIGDLRYDHVVLDLPTPQTVWYWLSVVDLAMDLYVTGWRE